MARHYLDEDDAPQQYAASKASQTTRVVNLTPHPLHIRDALGEIIRTVPPSGQVARLTENTASAGGIGVNGTIVPLETRSYGAVTGLPEHPVTDVFYFVPLLTALAAKAAGRDMSDLLVPGEQTRDENGTVNGCRTLARLAS